MAEAVRPRPVSLFEPLPGLATPPFALPAEITLESSAPAESLPDQSPEPAPLPAAGAGVPQAQHPAPTPPPGLRPVPHPAPPAQLAAHGRPVPAPAAGETPATRHAQEAAVPVHGPPRQPRVVEPAVPTSPPRTVEGSGTGPEPRRHAATVVPAAPAVPARAPSMQPLATQRAPLPQRQAGSEGEAEAPRRRPEVSGRAAAPEPIAPPVRRAAARELPGQTQRAAAPEPAPTIQVTIGRIEVRAAPAAPAPTKAGQRPLLSLDEYLRRRNGGRP